LTGGELEILVKNSKFLIEEDIKNFLDQMEKITDDTIFGDADAKLPFSVIIKHMNLKQDAYLAFLKPIARLLTFGSDVLDYFFDFIVWCFIF